jgi:hypothetical protein
MRSEQWSELTEHRWPFNQLREVNQACQHTAARMEHEGFEDLVPFFASLVARYAQWTWNLPASERHHHPFPFGLIIHGAETVERAVAVGGGTLRSFAPEWHKAAVAFALYHDCGRVFDVEMTDASGRVWDPLQQSLLQFCGSGPARFRWRPGRGLVDHEYRSQRLFPHLLPGEWVAEVRKPLDDAWYAYFHRGRLPLDFLGVYPYCVAGIVSWADQRSAQADRLRRKIAARTVPEAGVDAPVCYYLPKAPTRTPVHRSDPSIGGAR